MANNVSQQLNVLLRLCKCVCVCLTEVDTDWGASTQILRVSKSKFNFTIRLIERAKKIFQK